MDRFLTRALSFTAAALFALISARLVSQDARYAVVVLLVALGFGVPALLSRRRMRRLLLSGDVPRILGTWQGSLRRVTYPETMAPLMTATAYAAYGFIDAARNSLSRAARGPAWDAAVEQRLFVEALLDVYEGERNGAMMKATELEQLPLPSASFWMRRKISLLRRGIAAMARAFAHQSRADDERLLLINSALDELAALAPEKAEVVKLRFFVGLDEKEIAELLHVTPRTVERYWSYAKAWLFERIAQLRS